MELRIEHDENESSLCFSRDVPAEQKRLAQLSGDTAILSAILQKLIVYAYFTDPATDLDLSVANSLDGPLAVARCALRISALASKMFHDNMIALLPNTDIEAIQIWETVCLLIKDGKSSISVLEAATHLGWSGAAVQRRADIARGLGLIRLEANANSKQVGRLRLELDLNQLVRCRLEELDEEMDAAHLG